MARRFSYPSDAVSAERLTEAMARRAGINYMRTSRPKCRSCTRTTRRFQIPGFKVLRRSAEDKATVIGAGVTLHEALKAADQLTIAGVAIRVIDLYCVKPLDGKALGAEVGATGGRLVTVEIIGRRADWGRRCCTPWWPRGRRLRI